MEVIRTKLGDGGRIIIPAIFRQNLHLTPGDDIILHMKEDIIYITTPDQALSKLQAKVKNYTNKLGQDISLVDELIAARRSEVRGNYCIDELKHVLCHFREGGASKSSWRGGIVAWIGIITKNLVIARRYYVPTWQSKEKIAKNAMRLIIF